MFYTMQQVRNANPNYFSPSTLRFFRSRIGQTLYGGEFFITSEQFDWKSPRLYTIRRVNNEGRIMTVGDFQQYSSGTQARRAIMKILRGQNTIDEQIETKYNLAPVYQVINVITSEINGKSRGYTLRVKALRAMLANKGVKVRTRRAYDERTYRWYREAYAVGEE